MGRPSQLECQGRDIEKQHGKLALWNGDSSRLHVRKAQYKFGHRFYYSMQLRAHVVRQLWLGLGWVVQLLLHILS